MTAMEMVKDEAERITERSLTDLKILEQARTDLQVHPEAMDDEDNEVE